MKAPPLVLLALPLLAGGAAALPPLPGEEEAPATLFSAEIGDQEVDFLLKGSWQATLAGTLGFLVTPAGELVFPSPVPGLEVEQLFQQIPDLTFSVWLRQKYFLEGSLVGDFLAKEYEYFDRNYLLMGYRGSEDRFLRSVLLGTRDITIDPFPFVAVPDAGSSSLGASARLGSGRTDHQLLLRYDNNEPASLTYLGKNIVEESTLALDGYSRGRFFRLPDAGVDGLEVYLEDPDGAYSDGSGRRYRVATVDDAVLDSAGGTVTLKKAATGAVLVFYRKGGLDIGDASLGDAALSADSGGPPPAPYFLDLAAAYLRFRWNDVALDDYLGRDMDDRQVVVAGRTCLRLWKPGEFSPFEILGSYAFSARPPADLSRIRVQVLRKGDLATVSPAVKFRLTPDADYFTVYRDDDLRGNLRNLFPFLDEDLSTPVFDPDNLLYGPAADSSPGYLQHEMRVSFLTPVAEFSLGTDVVPGSVQVLRNGAAENRFELDAERGVVTFLTEISPDDRLVISFRRRQSFAGNGDFLFAWGNTISLGDSHTLQAAAGVRWNSLPGNFTETAYSRTGSAVVSAGLEGEAGPLRYKVSAAGAFTNPDTTGIMRLLGMEGEGREVALSEDTAYPAAPPAAAVGGDTLNSGNRGQLLYKDYRSYGLAGTSVLMSYTWTPPAEQQFPYTAGSKPGPYKAGGSSRGDTTGESLVLDFSLAPNEWVGAQLPVAPGQGLADLSGLQSISISYRALSMTGTVHLYVQIGETGEDLDQDLKLDEEPSQSSAGFLFDTLRVGSGPRNQGNNRRDTEDLDGNGRLDAEDDSYLLTALDLGIIFAGGAWQVKTHSFSPGELERLRRSRTLRLLVVESAGTPSAASGRLLVDRITLEGSRFLGVGAEAREVAEWAAADSPPEELSAAFPEVASTFHPFAEEQKVLEVSWSGDWEVRGYTDADTGGIDYRRIVHYYRLPAVAPAGAIDLEFKLLDASVPGRGVHWKVPISGTVDAWSKIEVSLDEGKVYRNGSVLTGATVTVDTGHGSLVLFTAGLTSTTSGTLYLDELHLTDPKSALGAAFQGEVELELPGELVTWGGHPVIHDLTLRQEASAGTRGFAALYGTPLGDSTFTSRTELAVGLSVVDLAADLLASVSGGERTLAGGHRLSVPNVSFPVTFSDTYREGEGAAGRDLYRRNHFTAAAGPSALLELDSAASSREGLLTQSWAAELGLRPWLLNFGQSLELAESREGFEVPARDYFSNWIGAYGLLAPWTGGQPVERLTEASLGWGLDTRPLGLRLTGAFDTRSYGFTAGGRTLASSLELELSLPLVWRQEQVALFSLTPGYRRRTLLVEARTEPGSLGLDLADGLAALAGQPYWFTGAPAAELFSPATEELFRETSQSAVKATYTPELFLSVSRLTSSRLVDLFLPSSAEAAVDKELSKDGDLLGFRNRVRLTLQSRALNLFGALGAYPLFPFYRTDEASGSVQVTAGVGQDSLEWLTVQAGQFLACEATDGRLTFENLFQYTQEQDPRWSDTLGALFSWTRRPPQGVRLPLLRPEVGAQAYWQHEESCKLAVTGGVPAEQTAALHPLNLLLGHSTTLTLPEFGYLRGVLQLGLDAEEVSGEGFYWRVGLKAGLEVRLEF